MAKLMGVLGEEIRRLARKEIKLQTQQTRKAAARHRREIAALKREIAAMHRALAKLSKTHGAPTTDAAPSTVPAGTRFSARSVAAQRRRLGLSAADFGKLVGVSGLTIYNWEAKKSHPRQSQLAKYVAIRGLGKREALERIA